MTRLDTKTFKSLCQTVREDWADELAESDFAGKRDWYRSELRGKRHLFVRQVADTSFEGHLSALRVAAMRAQVQGATEDQVRYLARLASDAGEAVHDAGLLTAAEASRQIDQMRREAARRA